MNRICVIHLEGYLGNHIFILGAFIKLQKLNSNIIFKLKQGTYNIDKCNDKLYQFILDNLYEYDIDESYSVYENINTYEEANDILNHNDSNIYITNSYFQSDSSLKDNEELKSLIDYKDNIDNVNYYINKFELIKNYDNYVIISVRRGDYLLMKNDFFVLNSVYYKTIYEKYFKGKIPVITSDDIGWCKYYLGDFHKEAIYIEDINPINIIKLCITYFKNIICSNSSFSSLISLLMNDSGFKFYPSLNYLDIPNKNLIDKTYLKNVLNDYNKYYLEIYNKTLLVVIVIKHYNEYDKFIEYYNNLGFDKIIMIINNEDTFMNHNVIRYDYDYNGNKRNIIEYIYYKYRYDYDWMFVINIGDYLILNNHKTINEYLNDSKFNWHYQIHINYHNNNLVRSIIRMNIPNINFYEFTFISDSVFLNTVNNIGNNNRDDWCHSKYNGENAYIEQTLY